MSRINNMKTRLGDMFLIDRGNVDERTAELIKSEVRQTLERFFILSEFCAELKPCDTGEVELNVKSVGLRLRNTQE